MRLIAFFVVLFAAHLAVLLVLAVLAAIEGDAHAALAVFFLPLMIAMLIACAAFLYREAAKR